ncbi:hypothetical protein F511_46558 [Dorcoceras hygrometricum]|uniref:Uncharacterized protein n=1 Tax=Dorcoceras hygrometricum TaxID=472368 RepID=A0A2Z7A052_9LAMI|nr:hypothetical protein F511_46558 [Dorcoceras hygrometricum]
MNKAEMLEALKERKSKSGAASSSHPPSKEKRQAPSEKERRKKHRHEEKGAGSTQESIPEVTISEPVDPTTKDPEQQSTEVPYTLLDASTLSFVSNPSGPASLDFIRHLVPDQDFDQLRRLLTLGFSRLPGSTLCSPWHGLEKQRIVSPRFVQRSSRPNALWMGCLVAMRP